MPVANPVGDHHAVRVCFNALHNACDLMPLHFAGGKPVKAVRAAYPVSLHQPHPQIVWLPGLMLHGQQRDCVTVHAIAQKREPLQLVEVVHPVGIADRRISPQGKFPHDLLPQCARLFVGQLQIRAVDLRRRGQATGYNIGAHGFQGCRCGGNAHISVPASLPQDIDIVLDVLFCAAAEILPAAHTLFSHIGTVIAVAAVDDG